MKKLNYPLIREFKLGKVKTKFILSVLMLSLGTVSNAQAWDNVGNNYVGGPGGNNYIGLTNNRNLRIGTTSYNRMIIQNGGGGIGAGRIAIGNNLPITFVPRSRFHLHQNSGRNDIRFTTNATGSLASNGLTIGLTNLGNFEMRYRELGNTDIFTRSFIGVGGIQRRFRINEDGQFLIGVPPGGLTPFSVAQMSLFNVNGPINSCETNGVGMPATTILYGYTNPTGNPNGDGYRFRFDWDYGGTTNRDYLIFEKTDAQHVSRPDGGIIFQNMGTNGDENISMRLEGTGRAAFGEGLGGLIALNNRVTIKSNLAVDAQPAGLRFVNLTSTATPVANPGAGVLGVDANGDVIYVDAGAIGTVTAANNGTSLDPTATNTVQLGQEFIWPTLTGPGIGGLLHHTEIPMNGFSLVLSGVGSATPETFHIGQLPFQGAKSSVYNDTRKHGFLSDMNTNNTTLVVLNDGLRVKPAIRGIAVVSSPGAPQGAVLGVAGEGVSIPTHGAIGVAGTATGTGTFNLGGSFTAIATNTVGSTTGTRTRATGNGGQTTIGISANASVAAPTVGSQAIAGRFVATTGDVSYGIYAEGVTFAALFEGDVDVNGILTTTSGTVTVSDEKFKKEVEDIDNAMDLITQLKPKTYLFDTEKYESFNFESDQQMGLIAQEVEKVIPTIVSDQVKPAQYDSLGNMIAEELSYKGVQYGELVPLLVAGMQEQQEEIAQRDELITDLNERLSKLEACLNNLLPVLCEINNNMIEQNSDEIQEEFRSFLNLNLWDGENIILNQNVPNPFAESTVITYTIPESVKNAEIHFYNEQGRLINTLVITERGKGQVNVFANNLSTGLYTYTLVADGEIVVTKKMMKQ